jgi:hypothetical protein
LNLKQTNLEHNSVINATTEFIEKFDVGELKLLKRRGLTSRAIRLTHSFLCVAAVIWLAEWYPMLCSNQAGETCDCGDSWICWYDVGLPFALYILGQVPDVCNAASQRDLHDRAQSVKGKIDNIDDEELVSEDLQDQDQASTFKGSHAIINRMAAVAEKLIKHFQRDKTQHVVSEVSDDDEDSQEGEEQSEVSDDDDDEDVQEGEAQTAKATGLGSGSKKKQRRRYKPKHLKKRIFAVLLASGIPLFLIWRTYAQLWTLIADGVHGYAECAQLATYIIVVVTTFALLFHVIRELEKVGNLGRSRYKVQRVVHMLFNRNSIPSNELSLMSVVKDMDALKDSMAMNALLRELDKFVSREAFFIGVKKI